LRLLLFPRWITASNGRPCLWRVVAGDLLVALGFYLIFLVYRENTFTSATIEVAENQKVISTGPYARVRHPMYASAILYLLGTPLALGSYWGLVPVGRDDAISRMAGPRRGTLPRQGIWLDILSTRNGSIIALSPFVW
jgi:hypothetical protein